MNATLAATAAPHVPGVGCGEPPGAVPAARPHPGLSRAQCPPAEDGKRTPILASRRRAAEEDVIGNPAEADTALRQAKAALRGRVLAARAGLAGEQRAEAGRLLREAVLAMPEAQMAGTVAAYYSVGTEPATRGLVYALWKRGTYVLLPLLRSDGHLDWAPYEGPESMAPARHGLLEPAEPGRHSIASADLIIVPALAADRRGNRLGRGRGCYDRALARVGPLIPVIALLYDGELVGRVPAGPLDRPVAMAAQPGAGLTSLTPP